MIGFVLGAGMATVLIAVLSEEVLVSSGWRIGFLLAAPMGMIALCLITLLMLRNRATHREVLHD